MESGEHKIEWNSKVNRVTLCFLVDEGKILLAMKKRGFGAGKWNGVGGKIKDGESIEDAAVREAREEIGITSRSMVKGGVLRFFFSEMKDPGKFDLECHVYVIQKWDGEPRESDEMRPQWFEMGSLPFESMWDDDKYWLPKVLGGKFVEAQFLFDGDGKVVDKHISERGGKDRSI